MVKRFHAAATKLLGEELVTEEAQALDEKRTRLLSLPTNGRPPNARGPKRERLARLIRQQGASLGRPTHEHKAGDAFEVAIGQWRIGTRFVYSENPSYMQRVTSPSGEVVADGVSYLASLGISGQTVWDASVAGEEEAVAAGMVGLPQRFISGVLSAGLPD
jgi:hypothetical protein